MTLHLVKLCVGIDRLQDLRIWQAKRRDDLAQDACLNALYRLYLGIADGMPIVSVWTCRYSK